MHLTPIYYPEPMGHFSEGKKIDLITSDLISSIPLYTQQIALRADFDGTVSGNVDYRLTYRLVINK